MLNFLLHLSWTWPNSFWLLLWIGSHCFLWLIKNGPFPVDFSLIFVLFLHFYAVKLVDLSRIRVQIVEGEHADHVVYDRDQNHPNFWVLNFRDIFLVASKNFPQYDNRKSKALSRLFFLYNFGYCKGKKFCHFRRPKFRYRTRLNF